MNFDYEPEDDLGVYDAVLICVNAITDGFTRDDYLARLPDEAWLYREDMREEWACTPGALAWVRKITKMRRR